MKPLSMKHHCKIPFRLHHPLGKCGENQWIEIVVLIFSLCPRTRPKIGVHQGNLTRGKQEDLPEHAETVPGGMHTA